MIALLFYLIGVFTILLGVAHFFFPLLFDFKHAIPDDGHSLKPFRLFFIRYPTRRSDVRGLAWVMNHCVSFTLVTIGILDMIWFHWFYASWGKILALWISLWWFLRAICQLYLGRRRGDWMILCGFSVLGIFHLLAVLIE